MPSVKVPIIWTGAELDRRSLLFGAGSSGLFLIASSRGLLAADKDDFSLRVVESGHSLTDGIMPPLESFVRLRGSRRGTLVKSTIPGSPMEWRWEHAPEGDDPDIRDPKVMANFDVLVITERVSLANTAPYHRSSEMALRWAEHAWRHGSDGAGARSILFATWVDMTSGPDHPNPYNDPEGHIAFRERMPLEMARWEEIRGHVNAGLADGMPQMAMIPGPLIMAAAHDDILASKAPGLGSLSDLFADDIHLNDRGNYLIALAHFAVIYNKDPRGLPANIPPRSGPDQAQAAWMQELVWRVLAEYRGGNGGD